MQSLQAHAFGDILDEKVAIVKRVHVGPQKISVKWKPTTLFTTNLKVPQCVNCFLVQSLVLDVQDCLVEKFSRISSNLRAVFKRDSILLKIGC